MQQSATEVVDAPRRETLPLLARFLRAHLRSGIRGETRVTFLLAKHVESLQAVPIAIAGCALLFVDLRQGPAHVLLKGTPWHDDPFDPAERTVMRRIVKAGDVAFDIGANIGLHAVLLSRLVGPNGKLYVFEPNPDLLPALQKTVEASGNTVCFAYAASDESRVATLFVPEYNLMASLANWTTPEQSVGAVRGVPCRMQRIDELTDAGEVLHPDFVKCDVEGAEAMVFRGAQNLLDRVDAPILLFELNQRAAFGLGFGLSDAMDYLATLSQSDFRFFHVERDATLRQVDARALPSFGNVLAVPASRMHRIS
jgi:FkbM family methyltransferase